ncbi:MAG: hypothetical protein IJS42_03420, partial [Synergistaceae bacterium]|nr:hypothetical protein [Synergistaceae bacterium]
MSKNLRVFLLSLLAVIFAASCAFSADITSYLEIAETDSDALRTLEEDRVEGYTFTTRFELTGSFEYTTSRGTNEVTYDMYTVDSWSVTESDDKDITWLNQYTISDDRVLILEGKLPAYSTSSDFNISVSATVSYTSGAGTTYEATPETPFETQIAVVADSAVATIEPALAYSDDTTVYFSSDVSPYAIDEKYEAYLVMPYNDEVASAYIYQDEFGSEGTQRVLLPAWLSYDIASTASITFDGEARTVITSLRFFYNDEVDYTPDDNAESSVHIIGVDTDDDMNQETTIFWNVHFGSAIHIADGTVAAISMKFGETSSDTIAYTGPDPVSYDIATDSTSTLSADELGLEITSGD